MIHIGVTESALVELHLAPDETIASDVCVGVWIDEKLIGWGDDYGTFHPVIAGEARALAALQGRAETLLDAATRFFEEADG